MTLTIDLPPETQNELRMRAAAQGKELGVYVCELIQRDLQGASAVDQALAPFRRQVAASGMTDEQLEGFFEDLREEVWQQKQAQPSQGS